MPTTDQLLCQRHPSFSKLGWKKDCLGAWEACVCAFASVCEARALVSFGVPLSFSLSVCVYAFMNACMHAHLPVKSGSGRAENSLWVS